MKQKKETVILNLDNELNIYNENILGDFFEVLKNEKEFIKEFAKNYELKLFTKKDKNIVKKWLIKNNLDKRFKSIVKRKYGGEIYIKFFTPYAFTSQVFSGKPPA